MGARFATRSGPFCASCYDACDPDASESTPPRPSRVKNDKDTGSQHESVISHLTPGEYEESMLKSSTEIHEDHFSATSKTDDSPSKISRRSSDIERLIPDVIKLAGKMKNSQIAFERITEENESLKEKLRVKEASDKLRKQSICDLTEQLEKLGPQVVQLRTEKEDLRKEMEGLKKEKLVLESKNLELMIAVANKDIEPSKAVNNPKRSTGGSDDFFEIDTLDMVPDIPEKSVSDAITKDSDVSRNATRSPSLQNAAKIEDNETVESEVSGTGSPPQSVPIKAPLDAKNIPRSTPPADVKPKVAKTTTAADVATQVNMQPDNTIDGVSPGVGKTDDSFEKMKVVDGGGTHTEEISSLMTTTSPGYVDVLDDLDDLLE